MRGAMFFLSILVSSISSSDETSHEWVSIIFLSPSLPRGMHIIIVIFIIATTIVFTTLEIRPNHLWSKLTSLDRSIPRISSPLSSYIHDFPANLRLTKNPLPRIRHELGFDDIIRGVNSAVGRSVEIGNIGADRPGKNTAPIFCREPSQLFRHNERVYGRNYAKLYAATCSNALETTRGKGETRFSPSTREIVGAVFIDGQTQKMARGEETSVLGSN